MLRNNRFELQNYLPADFEIPQTFFDQVRTSEDCCLFLISCVGEHKYMHEGTPIKELIGYSQEQFAKSGIEFWFSLIDPHDLQTVSDTIVAKFRDLMNPNFKFEKQTPLVLRYRLKRADGKMVWLRDTRYLIALDKLGKPKQVLSKIEVISKENFGSLEFDSFLNSQKEYPKILEAALFLKNSKLKEPLGVSRNALVEMPVITKREKEILMLIGEGLSTKMIANQCHISVNTVETHRRHLLEKLNAKNSMDLIRQASRIYWL